MPNTHPEGVTAPSGHAAQERRSPPRNVGTAQAIPPTEQSVAREAAEVPGKRKPRDGWSVARTGEARRSVREVQGVAGPDAAWGARKAGRRKKTPAHPKEMPKDALDRSTLFKPLGVDAKAWTSESSLGSSGAEKRSDASPAVRAKREVAARGRSFGSRRGRRRVGSRSRNDSGAGSIVGRGLPKHTRGSSQHETEQGVRGRGGGRRRIRGRRKSVAAAKQGESSSCKAGAWANRSVRAVAPAVCLRSRAASYERSGFFGSRLHQEST